jgi:hypothetical protein
MKSENYIEEYFTNSTDTSKEGYWRPKYLDGDLQAISEYDTILAEISDDDKVLDVGCGYHPFKGKIKNLIGIDKYNPSADVVVDMLDFDVDPESFDVVMALGSTNLHSFELIEKQIDKIVSWCRPGGRIYMRVNPLLEKVVSPKMGAYAWTINDISYFTNKHKLTIIKPVELNHGLRYTFVWQK